MAIDVGDTVWYHNGGEGNPLFEGKVISIQVLPGYQMEHLIIETETPVDPILVIRTYFSVSPDAKGPINLFRRSN